jgi:hypothetical protein
MRSSEPPVLLCVLPLRLCESASCIQQITAFGLAKQLGSDKGQTQSGAIRGTPSYMAAANDWIVAQGVEVVNVQTVVLPNLWGPYAQGTEDPNIATRGDFPIACNQFVRVWYRH